MKKRNTNRWILPCIVLSVSVLVSGCSDKDYMVIKSLSPSVEISCEEQPYDPFKVRIGSYERVPGYWLVRLDPRGDSSGDVFAVFDDSGREVCRAGKFGRGPEELLSPAVLQVLPLEDDVLTYRVLDFSLGRYYTYRTDLQSGGTEIRPELDLGTGMREVNYLGGGRYLCNPENNRYYFYDAESGTRTYLEGWDADYNASVENSPIYVPDLQTNSLVSCDSTLVYIYGLSLQVIYVHSLSDGRLLKRVYIEHTPEEVSEMEQGLEYHGTYVMYDLGDNLLLCYYDFEYEEGTYIPDMYSYRMVVMDKSFRPQASYAIPYVDRFVLDPWTGRVTTLSFEEELFRIYDLSEWMQG